MIENGIIDTFMINSLFCLPLIFTLTNSYVNVLIIWCISSYIYYNRVIIAYKILFYYTLYFNSSNIDISKTTQLGLDYLEYDIKSFTFKKVEQFNESEFMYSKLIYNNREIISNSDLKYLFMDKLKNNSSTVIEKLLDRNIGILSFDCNIYIKDTDFETRLDITDLIHSMCYINADIKLSNDNNLLILDFINRKYNTDIHVKSKDLLQLEYTVVTDCADIYTGTDINISINDDGITVTN